MGPLLLALVLFTTPFAEARALDPVPSQRADEAPSLLDEQDRQAYRALVEDLTDAALRDLVEPALFERADQLGLSLRHQGSFLELRPRAPALGAVGVLLLRTGPLQAEVVLAAPHPFDDLRTGTIAWLVFENAPVRALFVATQSRTASDRADPTRNPQSTLQILTEVLEERLEMPWFVQLHGFSPGTSAASAVVSGGSSSTPITILEDCADTLSAIVGGADVQTGRRVPQLAGLQNLQGNYLRDRAHFVHIELGRDLREELEANPHWCADLGESMVNMARTDKQHWGLR